MNLGTKQGDKGKWSSLREGDDPVLPNVSSPSLESVLGISWEDFKTLYLSSVLPDAGRWNKLIKRILKSRVRSKYAEKLYDQFGALSEKGKSVDDFWYSLQDQCQYIDDPVELAVTLYIIQILLHKPGVDPLVEATEQDVYRLYCELIENKYPWIHKLNEIMFSELFRASYVVWVNPANTALGSDKNAAEKAENAVYKLKTSLVEGLQVQFEVCRLFFFGNMECRTARGLLDAVGMKANFRLSRQEALSQFESVCDALNELEDPMVALCALYRQKKVKEGGTNRERATYAWIESGLYYDLISGEMIGNQSDVLMINASPFFIRKWANNPHHDRLRVTFALSAPFNPVSLLSQIYEGDGNLFFCKFEELQNHLQERLDLQFGVVGIAQDLPEGASGILNLLLQRNQDLVVYGLSKDALFNADRDSFIHSSLHSNLSLTDLVVIERRLGLPEVVCWKAANTKEQSLTECVIPFIVSVDEGINTGEYVNLGNGFRQKADFYHYNQIGRKASLRTFLARENIRLLEIPKHHYNKPFGYQFSPEIQLHFTRTVSTAIWKGGWSLHIHACLSPEAKPVERGGFFEVPDARKLLITPSHVYKRSIHDEEIPFFLENQYVQINKVRQAIKSAYNGKIGISQTPSSLSLKTFVYLQEGWGNVLSKEELATLVTISKSDLGWSPLSSITQDQVVSYINVHNDDYVQLEITKAKPT